MGGFGSGRTRTCTRGSVETERQLDIGELSRNDVLREGWSGNYRWSSGGKELARIGVKMGGSSLHLSYRYRRNGDEWEPVDQHIPIEWRTCRFGGSRPYFRCPGVINGRTCRRTVLRLCSTGKFFACRHCYRLSYLSQHEDRCDRALRKANKVRTKLGGERGMCSPISGRPKGMWHRTYERAKQIIFDAEDTADERLLLLVARLQGLDKRASGRGHQGKKGKFWR